MLDIFGANGEDAKSFTIPIVLEPNTLLNTSDTAPATTDAVAMPKSTIFPNRENIPLIPLHKSIANNAAKEYPNILKLNPSNPKLPKSKLQSVFDSLFKSLFSIKDNLLNPPKSLPIKLDIKPSIASFTPPIKSVAIPTTDITAFNRACTLIFIVLPT